MRKTLITLILGLCACTSAFAYGRYAHAAIVYIAEQNLTPTAAKNIKKLTGNRSLVYYASYCDNYKKQMIVDLGFDPDNDRRYNTLPHTFSIDTATETPVPSIRVGDSYVVTLIPFVKEAEEWLKTNKYEAADSVAFSKLMILVHMIGDLHCMGHLREYHLLEPEKARFYYTVNIHGENIIFHKWMDDIHITERHSWSYSDIAHSLDGYSNEDHKDMAKGTVDDWAIDVFQNAKKYLIPFKEGSTLSKKDCDNIRKASEELLVKAGYRMAEVLNRTFDPKYNKRQQRIGQNQSKK
ncbi:MAG: hypothetical protein HUJ95_00270 [Bacteroidales bacterium]|nr:hypothetical protein [Bacteroidales bacterium]